MLYVSFSLSYLFVSINECILHSSHLTICSILRTAHAGFASVYEGLSIWCPE
jgi:hypothetical protein